MKVIVYTKGDPSVGINSDIVEFNLDNHFITDEADSREFIRKTLSSAFGDIFEEKAYTIFEDEIDTPENFS